MSPCELTASITALANMLACKLTKDELALLATVCTQLGYTLETINVQNEICCKKSKTEVNNKKPSNINDGFLLGNYFHQKY